MSIALYAMSASPGPQDTFKHFVPRWWSAVEAMRPLPDQVVIACREPDYSGIEQVPASLQSRTSIITAKATHLNELYDVAIAACDTKWVAWCGLDDIMMPDAFADISDADAAGAELLVGRVRWVSGGEWAGSWEPDRLGDYNTLPACSPHTKQLWADVGGYPVVYFADWAFWAKVARRGVRFMHATRPQMLFDDGATRQTLSGRLANQSVKDRAAAEYRAFLEGLA